MKQVMRSLLNNPDGYDDDVYQRTYQKRFKRAASSSHRVIRGKDSTDYRPWQRERKGKDDVVLQKET